MSYRQYNHLHNNPYTNLNKNKLPQSILYGNMTPRKQSLIRNQSFENRQYNQDLLQLIAKIRSLQDDVLNQRFKNQALQRKIHDYQKVIDNMQYQVTSQNYQIQKYKHQIELSNEKNIQILKYQENLKYIGEEIQQLNNVLVKKSVEYQNLVEKHKNQQLQFKKLQQQKQLHELNSNMWKKQIDSIIQQFGYQSNVSPDISQTISSPKSSPNKKFLPSISFNLNNQSDNILKKIQLIKQVISYYMSTIQTMQAQHQKQKKQLTQQLIKQKQKQIKIQYDFKLLQQRTKDQTRKQDLVNLCFNDKKAEEIIEELLKKQDEYILKFKQMNKQIEQMKIYIAELEETNSFTQKIQIQEKQSIIMNLKKQNKIMQVTVNQLNDKIKKIQEQYQSILAYNENSANKQYQNDIQNKKRIRKLQEENHQAKNKIEELIGQINLLNREIDIMKNQQ